MIQVYEHPDASVLEDLNAFLADPHGSPGRIACPEHDPRWLSVLREALGHRPYLLVARSEGGPRDSIVGYLPLALVSSGLFGRFLVSLPYLNRAGVVASDPSVAAALVDRAATLAEDLRARYLELRHEQAIDHARLGATRNEKVRMVLQLPDGPEALFNAVGPKVRNQVRKAQKADLAIRWGGGDLVHDFYRVFAVNMRDLGTPVYPKRLFSRILAHFPRDAELAVVDTGGQPIAGALVLHHPGGAGGAPSSQVPSASCLRAWNHTNANMFMYHELLLRSMQRGSREFDFGRSSEGSGTYRFKKQWGAQPHPTVWQYHVIAGDMDAMRPDSASNQRRVRMWKRLPVWTTRLVGPAIVRGIP